MKKLSIILTCLFFVSCMAATQPTVKPTPLETPELKLRIEGVDTVKAEVSDSDDRALDIEERKVKMDEEKWERQKIREDKEELKSKLSSFCDLNGELPVFNMYSTISMMDWKNIQSDLSVLNEVGINKVVMKVFSGGGSAFAGMGIADSINQWKNRGMTIIGKAYGLIASATVPIFASCSERIASPSTLFMVHEAAMFKFFTIESHSDINNQKIMLDKMQQKYCNILSQNSNKDIDFWMELEKKTTWFDVDEAMEWGLVDKVE